MPIRPDRLRDAAALAAVLAALVVLLRPDLDPRGPRTIWVSPDGSDMGRGGSRASAVASLQRASDMARPGDEVVILPGVYRERLRVRRGGEPGRPVTFRAAEPGSVTISGEAEPAVVEALAWRDEGGGIFSAVVPWPIYRVRVGPRHAYHVRWGGVERLRELAGRPDAWDAFAYVPEEGRLYLHTRSGGTPAAEDVGLHDPVPSPWEWGNIRAANVWLEADHVVFEGLRFQAGVRAGIHLWSARDVVVRDCWFEGADYGVSARSPKVKAVGPLTVERSAYHNYPQRSWRDEWMSWDDVYAHYPHSSFVSASDDGVQITGNVVAHAGDAFPVTSFAPDARDGVHIRRNLVIGGTDDAFELDGAGREMWIARNLVYDVHQSLGLSPVLVGPVTIEENLFLHPFGGVNGAQLKLLNPTFDRGDTASTIRNVVVRHNTFVGDWLAWWNRPPVKDVLVRENLFAVQRAIDPPFHPGVTALDNRIVGLPTDGYPNPGTDPRWWDPGSLPSFGPDTPGPVTIPGTPLEKLPGGWRSRGAAPVTSRRPPRWPGAVRPDGAPWSIPRPGPAWLRYADHPATAPIDSVIAKELIGG